MKKEYKYYLYNAYDSTKRKIGDNFLPAISFSFFKRIKNTNLVIPVYHIVSDELDIKHTINLFKHRNIKQFNNDLDFFLKYFKPICLKEFYTNMNTSKIVAKNLFLLTFDDGYSEVYNVIAPILNQKGIPATFFLPLNFINNRDLSFRNKASIIIEKLKNVNSAGATKKIANILFKNNINKSALKEGILSIKYQNRIILDEIAYCLEIDFKKYLVEKKPFLTHSQIQDLIEQGFTIGSHSLDHPFFKDLSIKDQIHQTSASLDFFKNKFSLNYNFFSFPFSDFKVSKKFYEIMEKKIDLMFGTSIQKETIMNNYFTRVSMDNTNKNADKIIKEYYFNKFIDSNFGKLLFNNPF